MRGRRREPARFDPFRVLRPTERRWHLEAYREYLKQRDGRLDLEDRTLPRREAYFQGLEEKPVCWEGDVDIEGFFRTLYGRGGGDADERVLWLATASKANLIETYGVRLELTGLFRDPERVRRADPLYLYQMFEESYHTRILAELCRTYGIEYVAMPPSMPKRWAVRVMVHLPDSWRWPTVLAGEALGSVVFRLLLERTHRFAAEPAVEERMRSLMTEIWTDEVLHAAYLRAKVGRVGVVVARLLAPLIGWVLMKDLPPLDGESMCRKVLASLRRGIEIPPGLDWLPGD